MSKLTRANQKVFGETAGAVGNFGVFGSLAAGSPQYSKDPETIQSLSRFGLAFAGAVVGNKSPAFEDVNSLFFLAFRQLAYLFQQGIAEWEAGTEYDIGSRAMVAGKVFISKAAANLGHATTDTNWWQTEEDYLYIQTMSRHYPIGEVYVTRRAGNPAAWLGFGTWARWGDGRMIAIQGDGSPWAGSIDQQGGEQNVTLTSDQMPVHNHGPLRGQGSNADNGDPGDYMLTSFGQPNGVQTIANSATGDAGGGQAHENLPPYHVMWFGWLRTA